MYDDKDLNQYVSLKRLVPCREKEWKVTYHQKLKKNMTLQGVKSDGKVSSKEHRKGETKSAVDEDKLTELKEANGDANSLSKPSRKRHMHAQLKLSKSRFPSFVTITSPDEPFADILNSFRDLFQNLSLKRKAGKKPRVLVNSFDELEMNALAPMKEHMDLVTVGPVLLNQVEDETGDMFEQDESEYMEWLDSKEEKSVVYVAFGSECA